jgi:hypothetical protein
MKPLRQKMINDMRLRRFSESTQEAYVCSTKWGPKWGQVLKYKK